MVACPSCSAELDPLWKYCVGCGTPVVGPARTAKVGPIAIPGAIRPDAPQILERRRPVPRSAIIVIALAVVGSVSALLAASVSFR